MITAIVISTFAFLFVISLVLWGVFLRFGLRWAKAEKITWRRIILATALACLMNIALNVVSSLFNTDDIVIAIGFFALMLGIMIACQCLIIKLIFKISLRKTIKAWLITLVPVIGMVLFSLLIIRPFFFEAFTSDANNMAPTFVGPHYKITCPICGQPAYGSPDLYYHRQQQLHSKNNPLPSVCVICDNFHISHPQIKDTTIFPSDRFLVCKFIKPQRWDLVAFKTPKDPSVTHVKRLVGLPGETIIIKEGEIWANGKKLEMPEHIRGLKYILPRGRMFEPYWGSTERPAQLGPDEYFFLGDFSAQSFDSRFWDSGASNHNPYAVPESYLIGVATHIYWPIDRMRILK